MSWNNSGPYPQGGVPPNQGYYGGPPPQQPYPGAYPPPGGYPGGYPPGAPPPAGYPGAPPPGPGFAPPPQPPYGSEPFQQAPVGGYGGSFGDEGDVKGFDFSDKSIRRGFIRKVYSILMVQLSISTAFIAWFLYHEPTRRYVQKHTELFIISIVITFVALIAIGCCDEMRRKPPTNYIFLFIFTLAKSFMLATVASTYTVESVLFAIGLTVLICGALTIFAFQTKVDFTACGAILLIAVLCLLVLGIVAIIWPSHTLNMVYASLGAIIFSFYLIYDTQLMMGGNHKYSISPEEYVFAALSLYIDIVNIFMYILALVGNRD